MRIVLCLKLNTSNLKLLLHIGEELESVVGLHAVLAEVEPLELFFLAHADAGGQLQHEEDNEGGRETYSAVCQNPQGLYADAVVFAEDADKQRSENTADQMDGGRTNRVIKLDAVKGHYRNHCDRTADQADEDGRFNGNHVGAGGNADQTGQAAR